MSQRNIKIKIKHLNKEFSVRKKQVIAFQDINLEIGEGEFWCIVGPSGCGKTTLLRVLSGLDQQTSGVLEISHKDPSKPLNSMVFQEHAIFPWMTVWDNIAYGLKNRKIAPTVIRNTVEEYIEKTGLQKFSKAYPHQLSGGMKQRVSIARAFANDAEILFMDEPFASLDPQNRLILQHELMQIWEETRKTVVFITHSIDEAIYLSDYVVLLSAHPGKVKNVFEIEFPRPRDFTELRASKDFHYLFTDIWGQLREEFPK